MSKPRSISFTRCAAAFLDILGFKEFMKKVEQPASAELTEFDQLLHVINGQLTFTSADGRKQHLFPNDVGLVVTHVSDSFVLSAPMQSAHPHYNGLVAVSIKAIQIAHCLLDMGFLLRGGIAVGNVCRDKANVFGTAFQDAYEAERKWAIYPRILLHQSAADVLISDTHNGISLGVLSTFMADDGLPILDTLNTHSSYLGPKRGRDVSATYRRYKAAIEKNLASLPDAKAREKWQWMAYYFNAKLRDCSDLSGLAPISMDHSARFKFYDSQRPGEAFREAFAQIIPPRKVLG